MFGQWWMDKAHEMESPETAKYRIKALLKHFESTMKIQHIDGSKVKAYIYKRREEGKSGSTINKELVILKSAMGQVEKYWGQTLQEIDWKDLRQKEKKEHKIFVTPDEIKALISFLPDHIKIAVAWSIYTGSRLNEMTSLLRTNYYPNLCIAYVDTKGGGKRSIALSKAAIAVADRSLELIPVNYAYVFDLRGRRKAWERARAKIGRRDIRWHDLRHLTGSWLNNYAKAPSKTIKEIMGHSKLETTDQYIHAANEDLLRQLNQLPKIF